MNHPGCSDADAGACSSKDPDLTINDGIAAMEQMSANEAMGTTEQARATKSDLDKKFTSTFDKLDSMINRAEKAEMSLDKQNKQIKGLIR